MNQEPWLWRTVFGVCRFCQGMAAVLVLAIMVLTLWEVVSRYLFHNPSTWTLPLGDYLLLYVTYLGTAATFAQGGHIRVDFVLEWLGPRWRQRCEQWAECISLVYIFTLGYLTYRLLAIAFVRGEYDDSTMHLPLVFINGIMPVGMLLMLLASGLRIRRALKNRPGAGRG
ncbi:MAG: TRAP transporter small permease [Alicyclobacillus sp.]|nr:TRAP transporter small permease [Alicyclobacillus sp.]